MTTTPTELRITTFKVGRSHPDFFEARRQSEEARILRNALVAVAREANAYRMWSDDTKHQANVSIANSIGGPALEFIREPSFAGAYSYDNLIRHVVKTRGLTLNAKVSQRVGVMLARSWKSFFANKSSRGRSPYYTKRFSVCEYTIQAVSKRALRKGRVVPAGWKHGFALPEFIAWENVQAARLVPLNDIEFKLEVIHRVPAVNPVPRNGDLAAGIDLGVANLATVAFSDHREGIIVPGGPLKSVNAYYNKLVAKKQESLKNEWRSRDKRINGDTKKDEQGYVSVPALTSSYVSRLWNRRNRKIDHYIHTVTSQLSAELARTGVSLVVIGWSAGFKHAVNMGPQNNQKFVQIPHRKFVNELSFKLRTYGIRVEETEESYTSQASFLDGDDIPVFKKETQGTFTFSGTRVYRGLYRSAEGYPLNADLNGAYNILRKRVHGISLPSGVWDKGTVVVPVRRLEPIGFTPRRTETIDD